MLITAVTNMKRITVICSFFIFLMLICSACMEDREEKGEYGTSAVDGGYEVIHLLDGSLMPSTEGLLRNVQEVLYISDYSTGYTVPICSRPGCEHKRASAENPNPDCYAAYTDIILFATFFDDYLYVFCYSGENHTVVYQSSKTGENRRLVAECDYVLSGDAVLSLKDGKIFFSEYFEKDGVREENSIYSYREYSLGGFDLEENSFFELTGILESGYGYVTLLEVCDGRLYYNCLESDSADYSAEYFNANRKTMYLDIESGETGDITEENSSFYGTDGNLTYWMEKDPETDDYSVYGLAADGSRSVIQQGSDAYCFRVFGDLLLTASEITAFPDYVVQGCVQSRILVCDSEDYTIGVMSVDDFVSGRDEVIWMENPGD